MELSLDAYWKTVIRTIGKGKDEDRNSKTKQLHDSAESLILAVYKGSSEYIFHLCPGVNCIDFQLSFHKTFNSYEICWIGFSGDDYTKLLGQQYVLEEDAAHVQTCLVDTVKGSISAIMWCFASEQFLFKLFLKHIAGEFAARDEVPLNSIWFV